MELTFVNIFVYLSDIAETSITGSHVRLDHNMNSESTWSLETSIPQDFSVIEILQNEKYITKSSKYSTYDLYPIGRFFHCNRNFNYSAAIITIISTSKGVNYFFSISISACGISATFLLGIKQPFHFFSNIYYSIPRQYPPLGGQLFRTSTYGRYFPKHLHKVHFSTIST